VSVAAPELSPPQLDFRVEDVAAAEYAAVPTLLFSLGIAVAGPSVRSLALNVQVRIDAPRRAHNDRERERLFELFGAPADWSRTLRSLRWTSASVTVPPFDERTTVELPIACTYDFDVVATKYLHALEPGDVPLELLFSGSVFFAGAGGRLQVVYLPWDREARCELPVHVWRAAVETAFPGTRWLRVRHDVLERLHAYRSAHTLLTWDATLERLLKEAE
jgi:hypothetical protein